MKKILIVGASGFIGAKAYTCLAENGEQVDGTSRSQRAKLKQFDLLKKDDYDKILDAYDLIINCSDPISVSPLPLARYCLANQKTFIETTAHSPTLQKLLQIKQTTTTGCLILGCGLFPGVSNLLAKEVIEKSGKGCNKIEVAIELSPFAGAGSSMVSLMSEMLYERRTYYKDSTLITDRPVSLAKQITFYPKKKQKTLAVDLPESFLLHHSQQIRNTAAFLALRPKTFRWIFYLLSLAHPQNKLLGNIYRGLNRAILSIMRRFLFKQKDTQVKISAETETHAIRFFTNKGLKATAVAIAAFTLEAQKTQLKPGIHCCDHIFALSNILEKMSQLSGDIRLEIEDVTIL